MVTNPPYGERLEGDIKALYEKIGNTFKQNYPNTQAWMITSNLEAMKSIGLRPSRKIKLFNGKLESRLLNFPIYAGTKRFIRFQRILNYVAQGNFILARKESIGRKFLVFFAKAQGISEGVVKPNTKIIVIGDFAEARNVEIGKIFRNCFTH